MSESLGSFKSLEEVKLKATSNMEINGRTFDEGEIVAQFDKIQVSGLNEIKSYVAAHGGFDNRGLVYWETTKELQLYFSQGVFSNTQFALLNNAKVIKYIEDEPILITTTEDLESDEDRYIEFSHIPYDQIFCYNKETGEKLNYQRFGDKIRIDTPYLNVVVTYRYNYNGGASVAMIGQRAIGGFLELEAKTRVKDDTSGLITTGIIKIPKLKLMSGLSMKLGAQVNPLVGNFSAVGVPVGSRSNSYVVEIDFLNNDIDSDM